MRKNIFIIMVFVVVNFFIINVCYAKPIKMGEVLPGKIAQIGQFLPSGDITMAIMLNDGRTVYGRLALVSSFRNATGAAAIVSWMIQHQDTQVYIRFIHEDGGFYTVMVNNLQQGSYDTDMAYAMLQSGIAELDGFCELEDQVNTSLCTNFLAAQLMAKNKHRGLWNPDVPKVEYSTLVKQ